MPSENRITIPVDIGLNVFSSESNVHKTERFIKETSYFKDIDCFIAKLHENLLVSSKGLRLPQLRRGEAYRLSIDNDNHSFYFLLGSSVKTETAPKNVIFFKYEGKSELKRRNDQRLVTFMRLHPTFNAYLDVMRTEINEADFLKLYILSNSDYVNFPLLNAEQRKIVELEDQNVLVQGVAGSGKTNVCIDKIIFTACRAYAGRVLYTTFSRGLLIDTNKRISAFIANAERFVSDYENGKVLFLDANHKKAIESKLGIYFSADDDSEICKKVRQIVTFLREKVDYFLIEDLYAKYVAQNANVVGESFFIKDYVNDLKNHQLTGKLSKVRDLSNEVIYKEIYGMIFGCYDINNPRPMLSLEQYTESRKNSFSRNECETIYLLAKDYAAYLERNNLSDNNSLSRKLMQKAGLTKKYSLAIVDEVQDMTEVNLCLLRTLSRKMFCVGDALQMINPSYFSFAYLKRLLYEKDVVSVAELTNNYRNTKRIADIVARLGDINVKQFGTHSFVLKGESVDSDAPTATVYVKGKDFIPAVAKQKLDNFTVIVASNKRKDDLRSLLKNQEILTVSEVKGLERDVVVLYDVISDNIDKLESLQRTLVNRKQADENSVYRYYLNLFYVGISRAKTHIYVAEDKETELFKDFFARNFDNLATEKAVGDITEVVSKLEVEQDELIDRIMQFVNLGQFDNARFAANRIMDDGERLYRLNKIDVYEKFVFHGQYRNAGVRYWELGMIDDAKEQFTLSGDAALIELMDACEADNGTGLNADIIQFLPDVEANDTARNFIMETAKRDLANLKQSNKDIYAKLKRLKEKHSNG